MSGALAIGMNSPLDSRIWRILAHSRLCRFPRLERAEKECNRSHAAALPQVFCVSVYHFRTPSPGGQQSSKGVLLSAFFVPFGRSVPRWVAVLLAHTREPTAAARVCVAQCTSMEGPQLCNSRHLPLLQPPHSDLLPAETRWANRLLSAAQLAALARPRWVAMRLQVRLWALARTCCSASKTRAAASPFPSRPAGAIRSHATCRPACGQGGVLRSKTLRSETQCSKNY